MKRIFILILITTIVTMPFISGANGTKSFNDEIHFPVENVLNANFSHTVLVEYASKSTCPLCPDASSQLYSIYNSNDYDFYYVTIVTDKVKELPLLARYHLVERLDELGVEYVPDTYFDGGYRHIQGKQQDEQAYINAIEQSGERDVPDINLDVNVQWIGFLVNTIKITVDININEPEEFNGHLRLYITEKESQWTDAKGKNYHFVVLDIPVDKNIKFVKHRSFEKQQVKPCLSGSKYTIKKWWSGDITKDNCMVIATIFNSDTDKAVQTASAIPTTSMEKTVFISFIERFANYLPILRFLFSL